jgi:hypothetical protein
VASAVIGVHDLLLRDHPRDVTILSLVLIGVGSLLLLAAFVIGIYFWRGKPPSEWGGRVILAACAVATIAAGYLLVAEGRSLQRNPHVVSSAVLILVIGLVGFLFFFFVVHLRLGLVGSLAVALFGAGFGLFQFWYVQEYLPSQEPPALNLTALLEPIGTGALLEPVGTGEDTESYKATLTMKNSGSVKVIAFASTYFISGVTYRPRRSGDPNGREIMEPLQATGSDPYVVRFARHYRQARFTPVMAGKPFFENRYFDPGEEMTRAYVVTVPRCNYDLLSLRANVVVAKGELLRLHTTPTYPTTYYFDKNTSRSLVWSLWHVANDSWASALVHGKDRWIEIDLQHRPGGSKGGVFIPAVYLRVNLESLPGRKTDEKVVEQTKRVQRELGLATTWAGYELPSSSASGAQGASPQAAPPQGASQQAPSPSGACNAA